MLIGVMAVFERIKVSYVNLKSLRDLALYSWDNLNPRTFSIGRTWITGTWRMAGHGSAHDWYEYKDCIASSELVDFCEMLGTSEEEGIALRDHFIKQGFYKIIFDLDYNSVIGRPSQYLLRLNVSDSKAPRRK